MDIPAAPLKTAKPASSTRVAIPIQSSINHILGNLLGGMRHCSTGDSGQDINGHMLIYRHPNCESLTFVVGQNETLSQIASLYVRAGNGPVVAYSDASSGIRKGSVVLVADWDDDDTGWSSVVVSTVNRHIGSLGIWDTPRGHLETGDDRVEHEDSTQPMVALTAWDIIGASDEAGPKAMITESANAWKHNHPQHVSWWSPVPLEIDSASWTNPMPNRRILAKTRQFQSETVNAATYRVRAWCDASTTYSYRITSSNPGGSSDTVTVTGLTNTTEEWVAPITGLSVTNSVESDLTIEFQRTAGSGTIYFKGWSGGDQ
jgi:hypothetical protein